MRILFVADGRSPIARNWIDYFLARGDEVHLASTFACEVDPRLRSHSFIPAAFSSAKKSGAPAPLQHKGALQGLWGAATLNARLRLRWWLGPLTLPRAAARLRRLVERVQPDLVHAMRIPYEGMLAALAALEAPLLVSVWGNDFTLHAPSTPLMAYHTRLALHRADALHTDCQRDQRLALQWGYAAHKPAVVLPGAGGVQPEIFYPPMGAGQAMAQAPWVINPRGFRSYVRNDTFFRAIPLILQQRPEVRFICPAMAGEAQAQRWASEMGVSDSVELLPYQTRQQMAELFRRSRVAVSPSVHDGTPNTLLEGMACGCFPVAGDIESLREWIIPGQNGLLVDPADASALAQAILRALQDDALWGAARDANYKLVHERASYPAVMRQAQDFYQLVGKSA